LGYSLSSSRIIDDSQRREWLDTPTKKRREARMSNLIVKQAIKNEFKKHGKQCGEGALNVIDQRVHLIVEKTLKRVGQFVRVRPEDVAL